ncbi:MAG: hypothetical protein V3S43_06220 [Acidimicrobiia bacterium]
MNNAKQILTIIEAFNDKCADVEHTDVGDTWDVLHAIYRIAGGNTDDLDLCIVHDYSKEDTNP